MSSVQETRIKKVKKQKAPKRQPTQGGQMTFFEHLVELRNRLIATVIIVVVASAGSFFFQKELISVFKDLAPRADVLTNYVITDPFAISLKLSLYSGLLLSSPFIVYQIMAFLAPALEPETHPGQEGYEEEVRLLKSVRRSVWIFIPFVIISFVAGILFAYYLVLPPALRFLNSFNSDEVKNLIGFKDFVTFTSKIMFWSGLTFELPIFMFLLAKIRIVTWRRMAKWWRFAIVISFVAGAVISPTPDPFNQTLVAVPVFGLYWLGVLLARFA